MKQKNDNCKKMTLYFLKVSLSKTLNFFFKSIGAQAFQMKMNHSELEKSSKDTVKYSAMATMKDLRTLYKSPDSTHSIPNLSSFAAAVPVAFRASTAYGASNNATADDLYSVEAGTIQTSQVERMVQKALKRAPMKKLVSNF